jgi:hypothetical protein
MADERDDDDGGDECNRILGAQAAPEGLLLLTVLYDQSDAINPAGQVYLTPLRTTGDVDLVLSANEGLSALWVSPAGHAWVGGDDGEVWTTAPAAFRPPRSPELDFDAPDPRFTWAVTTLPDLEAHGRPPSISSVWGTGDDSVFAATAEGAIYHWDGVAWTEMATGVASQLVELHGSAPDDVFCVGHDAVILHYAGSAWTRVPPTEGLDPWAVLTGVRSAGPHRAVITEVQGRILDGDRGGFRIAAQADRSWHGVALFRDRWFLAANPGGAWELAASGLAPLKTNFGATDVFEVDDLLIFIEADQDDGPRCIVHDPADAKSPWRRRVF